MNKTNIASQNDLMQFIKWKQTQNTTRHGTISLTPLTIEKFADVVAIAVAVAMSWTGHHVVLHSFRVHHKVNC